MRILFIAPYGGLGGSENVLVNVLERLDRDPLRAAACCCSSTARSTTASGNWASRRSSSTSPARPGVLAVPGAAHRVPGPVDVIHANGGKAAIYGLRAARRLQGAPLIWMKHDHSYEGRRTHALAARCDHVVCVSHAMARAFDDLRATGSAVVYPGVTLRDLQPVETHRARRSCRVGRMDPFKGFDELLKAAAQLRAEGVELDVRLAGPQDRVHTETQRELQAARRRRSASAASTSAGPTTSTRSTRMARVVALASKPKGEDGAPGEGAPLVLMEAMGAGPAGRRHRHAGHRGGDRRLRIARRPARPPTTSRRRSSPTCRTRSSRRGPAPEGAPGSSG